MYPLIAQIATLKPDYAPPTSPVALDPASVLLRLVGLTLIMLLICGGVIWLARRAGKAKLAAGNEGGRLILNGQIPLDGRAVLHSLRVDGHHVVVTTDATGVRAILVLEARFEATLAGEGETSPAAEVTDVITS